MCRRSLGRPATSHVWCRRATFCKDKWRAKADALRSVWFQSFGYSSPFICSRKPFFLIFAGRCQFAKLLFGFRHFRQLSDCNVEAIYLSRGVAQKQVCKCVSSNQCHSTSKRSTSKWSTANQSWIIHG